MAKVSEWDQPAIERLLLTWRRFAQLDGIRGVLSHMADEEGFTYLQEVLGGLQLLIARIEDSYMDTVHDAKTSNPQMYERAKRSISRMGKEESETVKDLEQVYSKYEQEESETSTPEEEGFGALFG